MSECCRLPLAILVGTLLNIGCAVSPEIQERRQATEAEIDAILAEPPSQAEHRTTQRCLSDPEYRTFRALDDRHILFEGRRDRLWINTLRTRCPDLSYGHVLRVRSRSLLGRICALDNFSVDDWFTWPWYRRWPWRWASPWSSGIMCTLGEFQPVTKDQVEAIEGLIESSSR